MKGGSEIYQGAGHGFVPPGKSEPDFLTMMQARARVLAFLDRHLQPAAIKKADQ